MDAFKEQYEQEMRVKMHEIVNKEIAQKQPSLFLKDSQASLKNKMPTKFEKGTIGSPRSYQ